MFQIDPQLGQVLAEMARNSPPPPKVGDWRTIRTNTASAYTELRRLVPPHPEVSRETVTFPSADGTPVSARWFAPPGALRGSAVVFAHGGGMIAGDVDMFDPYVAQYAAESGVPILSVDYRLAPEATLTTPVDDVFAALKWVLQHAEQLGVDPARVAIMGESAGAGLAAGAAILAREAAIVLARQILIYPMLDDRTVVTPPHLQTLLTWTADNNRTGWNALLGDLRGTDQVPPHTAPARLTDHEGLAPAYIEVGEIDLFRDEDVAYAHALWRSGTPTELHVWPGAVHGFDQYLPSADLTRRAQTHRTRTLRAI